MDSLASWVRDGLSKGYSLNDLEQRLRVQGYAPEVIAAAMNEARGLTTTSILNDTSIGAFRKIGLSISSPIKLFSSTKSEGLGSAVKLLYVQLCLYFSLYCIAIGLLFFIWREPIFSFLTLLSQFNSFLGFLGTQILFALIGILLAVMAVTCFLFVPLISFVISGYQHLFVLMVGGKEGFRQTYKSGVYSMTPLILFGPLLFYFSFAFLSQKIVLFLVIGLEILLYIWGLFLFVTSLSIYQSISKIRSFIAWLLALAVFIVFCGLILLFLFLNSTPLIIN